MKTVTFYNHRNLNIDKIQRLPDDEAATVVNEERGLYVPRYKLREFQRIADERRMSA